MKCSECGEAGKEPLQSNEELLFQLYFGLYKATFAGSNYLTCRCEECKNSLQAGRVKMNNDRRRMKIKALKICHKMKIDYHDKTILWLLNYSKGKSRIGFGYDKNIVVVKGEI